MGDSELSITELTRNRICNKKQPKPVGLESLLRDAASVCIRHLTSTHFRTLATVHAVFHTGLGQLTALRAVPSVYPCCCL